MSRQLGSLGDPSLCFSALNKVTITSQLITLLAIIFYCTGLQNVMGSYQISAFFSGYLYAAA